MEVEGPCDKEYEGDGGLLNLRRALDDSQQQNRDLSLTTAWKWILPTT